MLQSRIVLDALQFVTDNLLDLILDAVVVVLDGLLHDVIAILITEVGNDGYRLIAFHLGIHLGGVHHNLGMKDLLLNTFLEGFYEILCWYRYALKSHNQIRP